MLDRQFERVNRFRAHDGKILASACILSKGSPLFITGANDQVIKIWDAEEPEQVEEVEVMSRTSNGKILLT
jgi:di- and tripeptidase